MKKLLSIFFLLVSVFAIGQNYPDPPSPAKLVNDFTKTLSSSEAASLESKLVAFDNETSSQIAVILIETTDGVSITDYATELARKWKVGNKQKNNGVVFLIAKKDRKLSIVSGYGLEGPLPDAVIQSIIDNEITPSFKGGDYYGGIDKGAEAIMKATQGAYTAPEGYNKRSKNKGGGGGFMFIIILVIIIFILSRGGGRGGGMMSRRGYRGIGGFPIIFPGGGGGGGWSGGGGSSGGGGGFGGFGGGSFGGGGASGSW